MSCQTCHEGRHAKLVFREVDMGLESFRIELLGERAKHREADEAIRSLPHVKPDPQSVVTRGSVCYIMDDIRHVIELELRDQPVRLSCRFTLCHPPSVDSAFLGLVRELMVRFGMDARICDDVLPNECVVSPSASLPSSPRRRPAPSPREGPSGFRPSGPSNWPRQRTRSTSGSFGRVAGPRLCNPQVSAGRTTTVERPMPSGGGLTPLRES